MYDIYGGSEVVVIPCLLCCFICDDDGKLDPNEENDLYEITEWLDEHDYNYDSYNHWQDRSKGSLKLKDLHYKQITIYVPIDKHICIKSFQPKYEYSSIGTIIHKIKLYEFLETFNLIHKYIPHGLSNT